MCKDSFSHDAVVFPAGAGVIPGYAQVQVDGESVSRRRGGDPQPWKPPLRPTKCFPQARG